MHSQSLLTDEQAKMFAKELKTLRRENLSQAEGRGQELIKLYPLNPRILCSHGTTLLRLKKFDDALRQFDATLKVNSNNEVALTSKGQVFIAQGKFDDALRQFNATLKVKPNDEVALNSKGQVFIAQGKFDDALRQFDTTLKVNSNNEIALLLSARVYLLNGNELNAADIIRRLLIKGIHPSYFWIIVSLEVRNIFEPGTFHLYQKIALGHENITNINFESMIKHILEKKDPTPEIISDSIAMFARSKVFTSILFPSPIDRVAFRVADPRLSR